MELLGRRKRGKPRKKFVEVLKDDVQFIGVTEAEDGTREKRMICFGNL